LLRNWHHRTCDMAVCLALIWSGVGRWRMTDTPDVLLRTPERYPRQWVVRLKGGVFLNAECTAPWCISMQTAPEDCGSVFAHQLRTSDSSLARIAEQVGYESEAAFNRAFKRSFGAPPATWRRDVVASQDTVAPARS